MFWVESNCFSKIVFFHKNMVSLCLIWSIHSVFQSIENFLIWERESLSVLIDQGWFSIDRNSWIMFFKKTNWTFSKSLFQIVFNFSLSLCVGSRLHHKIFCRFPSRFLQGFCPWRSVSPFYPSFSILFHDFMHYNGYFRHFQNIGVFDDSNLFWWNWSMGFCSMML